MSMPTIAVLPAVAVTPTGAGAAGQGSPDGGAAFGQALGQALGRPSEGPAGSATDRGRGSGHGGGQDVEELDAAPAPVAVDPALLGLPPAVFTPGLVPAPATTSAAGEPAADGGAGAPAAAVLPGPVLPGPVPAAPVLSTALPAQAEVEGQALSTLGSVAGSAPAPGTPSEATPAVTTAQAATTATAVAPQSQAGPEGSATTPVADAGPAVTSAFDRSRLLRPVLSTATQAPADAAAGAPEEGLRQVQAPAPGDQLSAALTTTQNTPAAQAPTLPPVVTTATAGIPALSAQPAVPAQPVTAQPVAAEPTVLPGTVQAVAAQGTTVSPDTAPTDPAPAQPTTAAPTVATFAPADSSASGQPGQQNPQGGNGQPAPAAPTVDVDTVAAQVFPTVASTATGTPSAAGTGADATAAATTAQPLEGADVVPTPVTTAPVVTTGQVAGTGAAPAAASTPPVPLPLTNPALFAHGVATRLHGLPDADAVHRMSIEVNPLGLGPVQVSAEVKDGALHVSLTGASEAARAALQHAVKDLQRELSTTGFTQTSVDVRSDLGAGSQQQQQHGADRSPGDLLSGGPGGQRSGAQGEPGNGRRGGFSAAAETFVERRTAAAVAAGRVDVSA